MTAVRFFFLLVAAFMTACVHNFAETFTTYGSTYNVQGRVYDQLLENLGGKRLVPLALGDDSKDIDWDFEQWKWKVFWPKFADLSARDR